MWLVRWHRSSGPEGRRCPAHRPYLPSELSVWVGRNAPVMAVSETAGTGGARGALGRVSCRVRCVSGREMGPSSGGTPPTRKSAGPTDRVLRMAGSRLRQSAHVVSGGLGNRSAPGSPYHPPHTSHVLEGRPTAGRGGRHTGPSRPIQLSRPTRRSGGPQVDPDGRPSAVVGVTCAFGMGVSHQGPFPQSLSLGPRRPLDLPRPTRRPVSHQTDPHHFPSSRVGLFLWVVPWEAFAVGRGGGSRGARRVLA